jgi:CheY-like chemotaxis protein
MKVVLVVDDEPFVSEVIEMALEDAGYEVISASNGAQGLERLAEHTVDIVITDHMMPVLDGPAMVRRIRASPKYSELPVILMSAVPPTDLRTVCPGAGRFLLKPFSLREVVRTVGELVGT